jgi:hypothetical protein
MTTAVAVAMVDGGNPSVVDTDGSNNNDNVSNNVAEWGP